MGQSGDIATKVLVLRFLLKSLGVRFMTRENDPEVSYDLAHDVMHSQPLGLVQNRFERLCQYLGRKKFIF